MKYPSKKEFARYEVKRPDFRRSLWRNRTVSPYGRVMSRIGTGEWFAWVTLTWNELKTTLAIMSLEPIGCPLITLLRKKNA